MLNIIIEELREKVQKTPEGPASIFKKDNEVSKNK